MQADANANKLKAELFDTAEGKAYVAARADFAREAWAGAKEMVSTGLSIAQMVLTAPSGLGGVMAAISVAVSTQKVCCVISIIHVFSRLLTESEFIGGLINLAYTPARTDCRHCRQGVLRNASRVEGVHGHSQGQIIQRRRAARNRRVAQSRPSRTQCLLFAANATQAAGAR